MPVRLYQKPGLHGTQHRQTPRRAARTKFLSLGRAPLLITLAILIHFLFSILYELGSGLGLGLDEESTLQNDADLRPVLSSSQSTKREEKKLSAAISPSSSDWCEQVRKARLELLSTFLHIQYPCQKMKPAISAIVCMLTDGVPEGSDSEIVFTSRDYINGVMALGASLQGNIDPSQTHQLLLVREGFEFQSNDVKRLQSVGWVIGTAPNFPLEQQYIPRYPRYKTTYTKVTALGLGEYKCVMLLDADTLVIGDLKEVMKCNVFQHPNNRVAGTIDWYQKHWHLFNTGSILWRPSGKEMDRVFNLTKDPAFMKAYSSDQAFLNNVYAERLNNTLNWEIVQLDTPEIRKGNPVIPHSLAQEGAVVPLSWEYNAQTHVEVLDVKFWETHRDTVRILHFTTKKGWQCERRYDPLPLHEITVPCKKELPNCYCREAHLYWKALEIGEARADKFVKIAKG